MAQGNRNNYAEIEVVVNMKHKGTLGKDYVTLKGRGGREYQNGATSKDDKFMHLSVDMGQSLICGGTPDEFLLTYSDVDIDCPKCIQGLVSPRVYTKPG